MVLWCTLEHSGAVVYHKHSGAVVYHKHSGAVVYHKHSGAVVYLGTQWCCGVP